MTEPEPGGARAWLETRTGIVSALRQWLDFPVRGGASWGHGLGFALLALFVVQCLTGAAMAAFYSPSVTDAWASVAFLETRVAAGAWLRGIHHFGTGAMVVLAVLHAAHVVVRGAYRAPREPNWWVGLLLLGLVLAYPLTGYTLVWDQLAYWSSKVRAGIAGSVPLVGGILRALGLGGNEHGNLTLTHTYAIHVAVLPLLTWGLILVHLRLFRRAGYASSDPGQEPYRAGQLARDGVITMAVVGGVVVAGLLFGARMGAPADPTESYLARPEWYFLPLFQLIRLFDGPVQVVGTTIIPLLVAAFLVGLPWTGNYARWGLLGLFCGAGALGGWAAAVDATDPRVEDQTRFADREAARALELAASGVPVDGPARMMWRDELIRGERVFRRRCRSCHALEGFVPEEAKGPDLTAYRSKAWLRQLLRDPEGPRFFGSTDIEGMPSYADVPEAELAVVVDMLYALRDHPNGIDWEAHPAAALIRELECADCHDYADDYALEGPAMKGYLDRRWIRTMIDHPDVDYLYGEVNEMPAFAEKLSDADRDALTTFLESLEHRAPEGAWPYVDEPVVTPPREEED